MTEKRVAVKIWAADDVNPTEWALVDHDGNCYPFASPTKQEYILKHMVDFLGRDISSFASCPEHELAHGREPVILKLDLSYDVYHIAWMYCVRLSYDGHTWEDVVAMVDEPDKSRMYEHLKISAGLLTRRLDRYLEDKKKAR